MGQSMTIVEKSGLKVRICYYYVDRPAFLKTGYLTLNDDILEIFEENLLSQTVLFALKDRIPSVCELFTFSDDGIIKGIQAAYKSQNL